MNTLFNAFLEAEVRKVSPSDYSLFQAVDMFCTLELLEEKLENEGLSNSEKEFFMSVRDLKKNYLKPAYAKRLPRRRPTDSRRLGNRWKPIRALDSLESTSFQTTRYDSQVQFEE